MISCAGLFVFVASANLTPPLRLQAHELYQTDFPIPSNSVSQSSYSLSVSFTLAKVCSIILKYKEQMGTQSFIIPSVTLSCGEGFQLSLTPTRWE